MKLTVKLSQRSWETWFLTATILLALAFLIVTTWRELDVIDVVAILGIAMLNFLSATLVGMHKQDILN